MPLMRHLNDMPKRPILTKFINDRPLLGKYHRVLFWKFVLGLVLLF